MDIATIIGIISGFGLILASLMIGSAGIQGFVDIPSVLVVIGGTIAATLIMFPLKTVLSTFKVSLNVFTISLKSREEMVELFTLLSQKVRKSGILILEKENFDDKFISKGVKLCVDGTSTGEIKKILLKEVLRLKERHKTGQDLFEQMGALAPAFGMIGTLIGLVQMLQNLSDPASIGPAMAVALLTTFYGAIIANLVCIPIAKKLELRSKEETIINELITDGVLSLSKQENPLILESKLEGYLMPEKKKTTNGKTNAKPKPKSKKAKQG